MKASNWCRNLPMSQNRIQRIYIGCAMLVWLRLKDLAYQTVQIFYQLKYGLLSNYLIAQQRVFLDSHVLGLRLEARLGGSL
jgi:hypothetical protein